MALSFIKHSIARQICEWCFCLTPGSVKELLDTMLKLLIGQDEIKAEVRLLRSNTSNTAQENVLEVTDHFPLPLQSLAVFDDFEHWLEEKREHQKALVSTMYRYYMINFYALLLAHKYVYQWTQNYMDCLQALLNNRIVKMFTFIGLK